VDGIISYYIISLLKIWLKMVYPYILAVVSCPFWVATVKAPAFYQAPCHAMPRSGALGSDLDKSSISLENISLWAFDYSKKYDVF
jgi:hypothetical protein